jgi:hypothetical protein
MRVNALLDTRDTDALPPRENRPPAPDRPEAQAGLGAASHLPGPLHELEDYFCRVFGWGEFDFLMASGCAPGLVPEYSVGNTLPSSGDVTRRADDIRNGRRTRDISLILTVLCVDGYIPPASTSWTRGPYGRRWKPTRPC